MVRKLGHEVVSLDDLLPYPGNARRGDVSKIRDSLREHGQYRDIVVQKGTNYILAGNHTAIAAREEGWAQIGVEWVECSEDEAKRIVLVDNKLNDDAQYNDQALADLLSSLEGNYVGTGFEEEEVNALLESLGDDDFATAMAGLGGDKGEFQSMSFSLHDDQAEQVREAMELANEMGDYDEDLNPNKNGNAIARVCMEFLRMNKSDADDD